MYPLTSQEAHEAGLTRLRRAIHPAMHAADVAAERCLSRFPVEIHDWRRFLAGWDAFYEGALVSTDEVWALREYARGLILWQGFFAKNCPQDSRDEEKSEVVGLVFPSDVHNAKVKVNNEFISVNRAIHACAAPTVNKIPSEDMQNWLLFKTSWDDFFRTPDSFFGATRALATVQDFERDLVSWQTRLDGLRCQIEAPRIVPPPLPPVSQPGEIQSTIKTVAIAAALIMGGSLLLNILPRR